MLAPHISFECFQLFYPAHKLTLRLQIWALSWPTGQRSRRRFGRSRETGGGCLGCNRGIGNSPIPPESLLLSVGCCLMNLCPENGIYLGTRGAAAALQCFLVPLKSPELPKPSWAAAQRILITNGPKTSSWGCLLLLEWLWFAGKRVAMQSSLFAPAPCYLLQLSICISHLQSCHCLFMLLSLCPIQSQPVFGSLCLFHCLIWRRARRCFLLLSPGAWEPGGRRLVTLVWPSPPSQPAIKIGGRGWGFQPCLEGNAHPQTFMGYGRMHGPTDISTYDLRLFLRKQRCKSVGSSWKSVPRW